MFFSNTVIGLATAASLAAAAPTPNTEIRSPEVEGAPGPSSWPPGWKREEEGEPGSSSWPPSWKRDEKKREHLLPGAQAGSAMSIYKYSIKLHWQDFGLL